MTQLAPALIVCAIACTGEPLAPIVPHGSEDSSATSPGFSDAAWLVPDGSTGEDRSLLDAAGGIENDRIDPNPGLGSGPYLGGGPAWCHEPFDPDAVYLMSTYQGVLLLVRQTAFYENCASLPGGRGHYISRDGRYKSVAQGDLVTYVPDDFFWNGSLWMPKTTLENDVQHGMAPKCNDPQGSVANVTEVVTNAETERRYFGCSYAHPLFIDEQGVPVAPANVKILAAGYDDTLLVVSPWTDANAIMSLLDRDRITIPIQGFSARAPLAVRAIPGGYWIALPSLSDEDADAGAAEEIDGAASLWHVSHTTGVATKVGDYSSVDVAWKPDTLTNALDASGTLYQGLVEGHKRYVVKRPLAPGDTQTLMPRPHAEYDTLCHLSGPCVLGDTIGFVTGVGTTTVLGPLP